MNIQDMIAKRTKDLVQERRSTFNTNDFMLEVLLNKKTKRSELINMIIERRIELSGVDVSKLKADKLNELIDSTYKTSKNGVDTSVSDSNNNSSFSYNQKYNGYELIKTGEFLEIIKIKK